MVAAKNLRVMRSLFPLAEKRFVTVEARREVN
jgi:hypothetical protein